MVGLCFCLFYVLIVFWIFKCYTSNKYFFKIINSVVPWKIKLVPYLNPWVTIKATSLEWPLSSVCSQGGRCQEVMPPCDMRLEHRRQSEKTTGVIFTPLTPHKGHFLLQWPLSSVPEVAAVKSFYCIPVTCISNTEDRNNSKAQFCQVSATATSHRNKPHCMN